VVCLRIEDWHPLVSRVSHCYFKHPWFDFRQSESRYFQWLMELAWWPFTSHELKVISTYNPIYGMYNPIYNQLQLMSGHNWIKLCFSLHMECHCLRLEGNIYCWPPLFSWGFSWSTPIAGWFTMNSSIKMDDSKIATFMETRNPCSMF